MKLLKQIRFEIKNILRSKFLLIIAILILAGSVVVPITGLFTKKLNIGIGGRPIPLGGVYYAAKEMAYSRVRYDGGPQQTITVDGVVITSDNPFFWNLQSIVHEKEAIEIDKNRFSKPEVLDLVQDLMEAEKQYYLRFAQNVSGPTDYRSELAWSSIDSLYDKFIIEHYDVDEDVLLEAAGYRKGMDIETLRKKYLDITAEERQQAYIKADDNLNTVFMVLENNDFPMYIDLRIDQANAQIQSFKDNIEIQQQMIVENPSQEENLNQIIEDYNRQINLIETNTIPVLQYRLDKNIVPGAEVWQNNALSDVENSRTQLAYQTIMKEEDFNKDIGFLQQYGSYAKYVQKMQNQINQLNNTILIAQNSLDAGKPDMKYVADGSRNKTVQFLDYSVFVALFGVLLGGWLIASEYQQGTIRLLMIRPRTRTKILMAKFAAGLAICLAMYLAGSILNLIVNGICYGFSDYAFPNYTITGHSNFFVYYLPKLLVCILPILFGFAVAFVLSVTVKNIAVAIAVPIVCFVGSTIAMTLFAYREAMSWIAWTPVPFVQISSFFTPYSPVQTAIQNGIAISMPYGISLLVVLAAVCTFISIVVFRKRDIAN